MSAIPASALPSRSGTVITKASTTLTSNSDEDAVPGEDTTEVTKLFQERLKAWKYAVTYLEDYIHATEKLHHGISKDYEGVLKKVSSPLKEGHHFDQNLGGIAGFFDNLRSNTQGIANSHAETAKTLKGSVLPIFDRLKSEIKHKTKELVKGAGKGSKAVDKARNATQKHIELLGQHTANFESTGGKISSADDPYVLQRGVRHRLNRQIIEENANRADLLAVQNNFASFEASIIQSIQSGLGQFNSVITKQADLTKSLYGDVIATAQRIPTDFEWNGFLSRNHEVLIDPNAAPRDVKNISFANAGHRSTEPIIAGSLEKRGKLLRKYEALYYVVTPSKFLHEYKTDDDYGAKEPLPEMSLFLPDCTVGQVVGEKFTIKGKSSAKGPLGVSLHTTHEFNFKAHTAVDAQKWWEIIRAAAGQVTSEGPLESLPVSPVSATGSNDEKFAALAPAAAAGTVAAGTATAASASGTQAQPAQASGTTTAPVAAPAAAGVATETAPAYTESSGAAAQAGPLPEKAAITEPTGHPATTPAAPAAVSPVAEAPVATSAQPAATTGAVSTSAGPGEKVTTLPAKT